MIEIDIADQQSTLEIDARTLESAIRTVLSDYAFRDGTISLALVTDPVIHALNRQYLAHDYPTDVLSFVFERSGDRIEGEILVSTDTAQRASAAAGWPAHHELLMYVIHGVLHLVGCDDQQDAARRVMRREELKYLAACNVPVPQGGVPDAGGAP